MQKNQNVFNNELLFLTVCSKTNLLQSEVNFIYSHINSEDFSLNTLIHLANIHGIIPLVYKTIKNQKVLIECKNFNILLSELKIRYMEISQRNMLMSAELIRITKLLKQNHIESVSFKGPTLSQMAYKDITMRQYGDLDILINENQLAVATDVLQNSNYKLLYPQKVIRNKTCLNTLIDIGFLHKNINIELHWKLLQSKHAGEDALTQIDGFTKNVKINSYEISSLSDEMLLVYLCLHGSKHMWERIGWICDIDRLIRVEKFNWKKSMQIANSSKLRLAFLLGLNLTNKLFDTPLPKEILDEIKKADIASLIEITIAQLNNSNKKEDSSIKNKQVFFYQLKLYDSTVNKVSFILHSFLKISPADCMTYTLPYKLKFLYIVLRPFRLASKYIKR